MNSIQNFVNSYKYNVSHSVKNFLLTPSSSKLMNIFSGKESADGHHDKSYRNNKVIRYNLYLYISPFLWRWTTYIFDTETFLSNRIHGVFALKLALFCDESHVLTKPLDKRNVMQNVLAIQFSLELRTVCLWSLRCLQWFEYDIDTYIFKTKYLPVCCIVCFDLTFFSLSHFISSWSFMIL